MKHRGRTTHIAKGRITSRQIAQSPDLRQEVGLVLEEASEAQGE